MFDRAGDTTALRNPGAHEVCQGTLKVLECAIGL